VVLAAGLAGLKLGGPLASDFVLKGTTFEVDLLAWLNALDTLISVLATPLAPAAYVTAVSGAAATFQTAMTTFIATVSGGAHQSLKVKVE
jgi:hypothetical protein